MVVQLPFFMLSCLHKQHFTVCIVSYLNTEAKQTVMIKIIVIMCQKHFHLMHTLSFHLNSLFSGLIPCLAASTKQNLLG